MLAFAPRGHVAFGRNWENSLLSINADYEGNFAHLGAYQTNSNHLTVFLTFGFLIPEPRLVGRVIDRIEERID
jgi:hypothetical protein